MSGKEIRFLRKEMRLKVSEFATVLSIDPSTLSRFENGHETSSEPLEKFIRSTCITMVNSTQEEPVCTDWVEILKHIAIVPANPDKTIQINPGEWLDKVTPQKCLGMIECWCVLFCTGAALAGNWIFLFQAYRNTTIALAAVSYYTAPVMLMMVSPFILKERLSLFKVICILVTLIGMFLLIGINPGTIGSQNNSIGIFYGVLAAICYATLMLLNKFLNNLGGLETTVPQLVLAAILLLPYVLFVGELNPLFQSNRSIVLLIVLGLVHTGLGFLLFFVGIKGLKTQEIAMLSYLDPLTAVLISLLFFQEKMTTYQIIGACLICGATFVGTTSRNVLLRMGLKRREIG